MINQIKDMLHNIFELVRKLQIIIVALAILVLLGFALIQVNQAISPTPDPETENQAMLEQQTQRIRYDEDALQQIRELENVPTNIQPSGNNHSPNPFSQN